jgi:predicted CopG family antitoxin
MKRTNISLTDELYEELRLSAYQNKTSISKIINHLIASGRKEEKISETPEEQIDDEVLFRKTACKKHKVFTCGCRE